MITGNGIPIDTVRGRVRWWIEKHSARLGDDVIEIGSRLHVPNAWWCVNRDLARGKWTGVDMQPGDGVDVVADANTLPGDWTMRFSGGVCSEVLEHARRPGQVAKELRRVLKEGAWAIFTVPACFPQHAFPDDYWRFTESGLRALLEDSGFVDIETASAGEVHFTLDDHGEGALTRRSTAMHTLAIARAWF